MPGDACAAAGGVLGAPALCGGGDRRGAVVRL